MIDSHTIKGGMIYMQTWGPARHAANAAFIALQAAGSGINIASYKQFAQEISK